MAGAVLQLLVVVLVAASTSLWPARGPDLDHGSSARPRGSGPGPGTRPHARRRWRAATHRAALEGALAELVAALAAPLRAGVPPTAALSAAAPTFRDVPVLGPLLDDLCDAATRGAPLAEIWLAHARGLHSADLSFIGRAWALSELTGAPLADALACSEQVLRARARARHRLASATAGPKASMAVLCLLPASGPVVGAVMGVDPVTLYFSSPVGTGSLVLGVALGLAAWGCSRHILRRAG